MPALELYLGRRTTRSIGVCVGVLGTCPHPVPIAGPSLVYHTFLKYRSGPSSAR